MILDEETSKRLFESFRYVGECLGELFVAINEAFVEIANAFSEFIEQIPDIIDELNEIAEKPCKTKPPRDPVRCIGCRPKTQVPIRKNYRVQRR